MTRKELKMKLKNNLETNDDAFKTKIGQPNHPYQSILGFKFSFCQAHFCKQFQFSNSAHHLCFSNTAKTAECFSKPIDISCCDQFNSRFLHSDRRKTHLSRPFFHNQGIFCLYFSEIIIIVDMENNNSYLYFCHPEVVSRGCLVHINFVKIYTCMVTIKC